MLTTRVLLTEDRLAQDFVAALERRELPENFFYWFPTSVRAWLNLCSDGAYRNYVRSHGLVQTHAADVVAYLPEGDVAVVSLGAGQGDKDRLVLEELRAARRRSCPRKPANPARAVRPVADLKLGTITTADTAPPRGHHAGHRRHAEPRRPQGRPRRGTGAGAAADSRTLSPACSRAR